MLDLMTQLKRLRRPRMLMRAARIGAADYKRDVHLTRILGPNAPDRPGAALIQLIEIEALYNDQRLSEGTTYSLLSHVEVMIAIVSEANAWRTSLDMAS